MITNNPARLCRPDEDGEQNWLIWEASPTDGQHNQPAPNRQRRWAELGSRSATEPSQRRVRKVSAGLGRLAPNDRALFGTAGERPVSDREHAGHDWRPGSRIASAGRAGRWRAGSLRFVSVIDWLLGGDPAIGWQVLRDLANAPADDVAAERSRVEKDGWGARSRFRTTGTTTCCVRWTTSDGRVRIRLPGWRRR